MSYRMILNETSYFGKGALENLLEEVRSRGFKKTLLVTDKELAKLDVLKKVTRLLDSIGHPYEIYSDVKSNPTVDIVKNGVALFKNIGADSLIAVGGGSSIDTSKGIGIIINNPEFSDVVSLEGNAPTKNPAVPIIAIPTTAGTAAEVTINYVITDEEKRRKFVCVDVHDIPKVSIVDPDMMASMPKGLAASTGMDALTHAIEGYITKGAWEMTDMVHIKSIQMIAANLKKAVDGDPEAKEKMSVAQYIAGMGYSNVGLGIVHSMAHALGAFYDMAHGVANAVLLPYVMEYNAPETGEKYKEIARAFGVQGVDQMPADEYRKAAVEAVRQLSKDVGIPSLKELDVLEGDLKALASGAIVDVCTGGNPRDTSEDEIYQLFCTAYEG